MSRKNDGDANAIATGTSPTMAVALLLHAVARKWCDSVNTRVPEPYLDEFFHVGQAKTYLAGRFSEWDPKITTPPGLYIISTAISAVIGPVGIFGLRTLNAAILPLMIPLVVDIDAGTWNAKLGLARSRRLTKTTLQPSFSPLSLHALHSAFNICLFPPLFFFSALYYTDIASTVSVVLCYRHFVEVYRNNSPTLLQEVVTVLLGVVSLSFRQTNIFWVSVFPAGLLVVSKVDLGLKQNDEPYFDPAVREAYLDDYFNSIVSLVVRVGNNLIAPSKGSFPFRQLIRLLAPFVTILGLFAAFVLWNGGVVLGDKSNHVATLHLTQMLYLWPYMTFFSIPLTYPYLVNFGLGLIGSPSLLTKVQPSQAYGGKGTLPRFIVLIPFTVLAVLVVHYNTIVHPFTLADNRHYTFYVFRLLLRHRATRYLVTPLYILSAWSIIQTLGATPTPTQTIKSNRQVDTANKQASSANDFITSTKPPPKPAQSLKLNHASAGEGSTASFILVWLATSALQLVTAPLVEPRYFILPWLMWRLRVPQVCPDPPSSSYLQPTKPTKRPSSDGDKKTTVEKSWDLVKNVLWYQHDHRLWLETGWFLIINAVTGWVFLNKGFEWKQEPGLVQRFMW